jgi:hypothetical protein
VLILVVPFILSGLKHGRLTTKTNKKEYLTLQDTLVDNHWEKRYVGRHNFLCFDTKTIHSKRDQTLFARQHLPASVLPPDEEEEQVREKDPDSMLFAVGKLFPVKRAAEDWRAGSWESFPNFNVGQ